MPWKECHIMDERLRFVARLLEGEQMAPLCAEFGISRKTGYKIFDRYKDCGVAAFTDRRDKAAGGFDENDHRQDSRRGRVAGNGLGSGESANVRARLRASRGCARRENNDYLRARLRASVDRARHPSEGRPQPSFWFSCGAGRRSSSKVGGWIT